MFLHETRWLDSTGKTLVCLAHKVDSDSDSKGWVLRQPWFMECAVYFHPKKELQDGECFKLLIKKLFENALNRHIQRWLQRGHAWMVKCDELYIMSQMDFTSSFDMEDDWCWVWLGWKHRIGSYGAACREPGEPPIISILLKARAEKAFVSKAGGLQASTGRRGGGGGGEGGGPCW